MVHTCLLPRSQLKLHADPVTGHLVKGLFNGPLPGRVKQQHSRGKSEQKMQRLHVVDFLAGRETGKQGGREGFRPRRCKSGSPCGPGLSVAGALSGHQEVQPAACKKNTSRFKVPKGLLSRPSSATPAGLVRDLGHFVQV